MKIRKTRFIGALMVAVMLMLSLAACDSGGGGSTSGKSNADLLKEAAANMKTAKSYHLGANVTQNGQPVALNGDIDESNDKYKLDITSGGKSGKVIRVNGKTYISEDAGTTWKEDTADLSSMFKAFSELWTKLTPDEVDKAKDKLKDGSPATENIEGVSSKHMTVSAADLAVLSQGTGGTAPEGNIEMWVSTGATPYVSQLKTSAGTITWSKINEPITVEAPQVSTP